MTIFLSVEMASVPSYVLAGILKGRRRSSLSLKYAVYGIRRAGVMLYGISLLAGLTGSAHCRRSPQNSFHGHPRHDQPQRRRRHAHGAGLAA
jgi:NADH-quinone oxidoreductase subunit N